MLNSYALSVDISVISPVQSTQNITINADGIVIAKNRVVVSAKTTGVVTFFVHNNSFIKKGSKIAYIKDERRVKKLKLLKQKLLFQKSEISSEKAKLTNIKEMYAMGVTSKNIYLSEKLFFKQLQERYENTNTAYLTLALEEKNALIVANEDSVILNLLPQNSYVSYGMTLATLLSDDTFVKLFVDARYIHQLHKGLQVRVISTFSDTEGVVSHVLPKSSNNLSEVIVLSKTKLPLNLRVSADIVLKSSEGVLIPKESIVLVDNHPAVYVIKNAVAHLVFVDIVKDMIDKVLIKNRLVKGAKIALQNAYMLQDNVKVNVK